MDFSEEFKNLLEERKNLTSKMKILDEKFIDVSEKEFEKWAKFIFNKYPTLEVIWWTAYTPYFNDGDPCTFRSNHHYFSVNSDHQEEINEEGFSEEELKTLEPDISSFLSLFSTKDMEELFGDHVKVTITKNGVDTEEHENHH